MRLGDIFTETVVPIWLTGCCCWLLAASNSISLTIRSFVRSLTHSLTHRVIRFIFTSPDLHLLFTPKCHAAHPNRFRLYHFPSLFLFQFHSLPVHSFRFGWLCVRFFASILFSPLVYFFLFLYFCVSSMSLCRSASRSFGITTRTHKFVRIYLDILSNSI